MRVRWIVHRRNNAVMISGHSHSAAMGGSSRTESRKSKYLTRSGPMWAMFGPWGRFERWILREESSPEISVGEHSLNNPGMIGGNPDVSDNEKGMVLYFVQ